MTSNPNPHSSHLPDKTALKQKSSGLLSDVAQAIRSFVRPNFYRLHLAYFVITILITSAIFYGANTSGAGNEPVRYIDALFLTASSMTTTGLNTIDLNVLTGYQQSILFVLMLLGDLSTVSIVVVVIRRWFFRKRIGSQVASSEHARKLVAEIDEELANRHSHHSGNGGQVRRRFVETSDATPPRRRSKPDRARRTREHHMGGPAAPWETGLWQKLVRNPWRWPEGNGLQPHEHHYLSFEPRLDDRGRFRRLTDEEYTELGGVEYKALKLLCWLLPLHTAFWILGLMVILAPYASQHRPTAALLHDSQPGHLSPGWWGVFMSISAYTNCGLSLLNADLIPFQRNWLILIVMGAGIIAGNTFYPIFLRFYLWILSKVVPKHTRLHHSIAFLLHHPRRCYLFLFDSKTTWILFATQLGLILGEWMLFEVLNIHQTAIAALGTGTKTMDGLFQCLGTRSSGLYIVTISSIAPAIQILYLLLMYLSVFPLLITLRTTNVYEERSVGLDAEEADAQDATENKKQRGGEQGGRLSGMHIRNQLAYDLWWIALAWILICVVEEPQLNTDAQGFGIFPILFEVVSAYGNCGLSLGVPYAYYSLSGQFHTLSKLILIPVMLRGRHRILPLAIDRSIMIPGQGLMEELDRHYVSGLTDEKETERQIRRAERGSQAEIATGGNAQDPEDHLQKKESSGEQGNGFGVLRQEARCA